MCSGRSHLKVYLADSFSDEEGSLAHEGKTVYLQGSKENLLELCRFFEQVAAHLGDAKICHMHFRDSSGSWNKQTHIDVVVDTDENT
jgi:hypothetical protein